MHINSKAKMGPFCGWDMPIEYPEGTLQTHLHTRSNCGLFDVSHMGQLIFKGDDRIKFLESLVVGDIQALNENQARLSLFTNSKGGIKDDTIITKASDHLYVVVNAGCADKDIEHITKNVQKFSGNVEMHIISDKYGLLAIQGPKAVQVLQKLTHTDLSTVNFMTQAIIKINPLNINVRATRCGYTGEDGFEISVAQEHATKLAELLLKESEVKWIGLGARDSLRLEAGLCLYGNDITEETTPAEAMLLWTISKKRKENGGFPGFEIIRPQIKLGVKQKRVGITLGHGIARPGHDNQQTIIKSTEGSSIGYLTSGSFSPILKKGIAMGYVDSKYSSNGTSVLINVRGKDLEGSITQLPFVPTNYYKSK